MLRRLDVATPWRSLAPGFWDPDLPFGCKTVVYGHNGSGKSTLSELLLSIAEGACATSAEWEDENGQKAKIRAGGAGPAAPMAVFTRRWVDANLREFLDGDSASAIVTLGSEAIDAKDREARLTDEIRALSEVAAQAREQQKAAEGKAQKIPRAIQDRIVSELKEFDYTRFTKNRYSVPKVQGLLRQAKGEFPNDNAHADALKRLAEDAPAQVAEPAMPPAGVTKTLERYMRCYSKLPSGLRSKSWPETPKRKHGLNAACICTKTAKPACFAPQGSRKLGASISRAISTRAGSGFAAARNN